ncbi:MAG: outer membrane beta-barrel protein [Thermodesulfobacteriota bacterium]
MIHFKPPCVPIWIFFLCFPLTTSAIAGNVYMGLDVGYSETRFHPEYTYVDGSPSDTYLDPAYGQSGSLLIGYTHPVFPGLALGLQGRFGYANDTWTLDTNEPAHLTYQIPYFYTISLRSTLQVVPPLLVFLDAGIGQGYIQERKESPTSSQYDFKEWKPGYSAGGGIEYHLTENWSMNVSYRYTAYEKISFESYLPNGSHWETIEDTPNNRMISWGLTWHFLP